MRIHKLTIMALALAPTCGAATAQQMTKEQFLQQTYQRSGMLLRAGTVCEEKQKEYIEWSFKVQTLDDDVKAVAKAFPKLAEKWMIEGASQMNSLVMQEGVKSACLRAYIQLMNVAVAVSNEQKAQKR